MRNMDGRCYICSSIWYCTCNNESNIGEADVQYMAEGAGQELALGSLYSTTLIKTPRKRVRMALEAAAKFNTYRC